MNRDTYLLVENGGHINLTKYWTNNLLTQMNFVKRKVNAKTFAWDILTKFFFNLNSTIVEGICRTSHKLGSDCQNYDQNIMDDSRGKIKESWYCW